MHNYKNTMKLYYSPTSPYARKVRMLIVELGMEQQIENIIIDPFNNKPELLQINPLGKVPTLVINEDKTLFSSPLICRYLMSLNKCKQLVTHLEKWQIYRWEALSDGLTDTAYNLMMENHKRPKNEQSPKWISKWSIEIKSVLGYIEKYIEELGPETTLAHLAIGSSIGYLDFRFQSILHKKNNVQEFLYPNLLNWYSKFSNNESMKTTIPK
ncbi:MAG: glutathione S-transferase [Proteobacteria bacterium]|nr:glutathione S-transferase [Pseudomonadota bacterium]